MGEGWEGNADLQRLLVIITLTIYDSTRKFIREQFEVVGKGFRKKIYITLSRNEWSLQRPNRFNVPPHRNHLNQVVFSGGLIKKLTYYYLE